MRRIMLLLAAALFLTGCGEAREADAEYDIYYVNAEGTALAKEGYNAGAEETCALVEELLERMDEAPEDPKKKPARPDMISRNLFAVEDAFLYLDYGQSYLNIEPVPEVLYRAAVVKTLTQIPGIEGVSFQVEGIPLTDRRGNAIGVMTADSFVDSSGEAAGALQRETLQLYFACEDGSHLTRESVEVVYNGSLSMEKLVLEQLIAGPKSEEARATLPPDLTVLNISVTDGTCYVNFDGKFQQISADISEDAALYSVVDSLTELSAIQRVQISVNGETDLVIRESRRLDEVYERNLELVEEECE